LKINREVKSSKQNKKNNGSKIDNNNNNNIDKSILYSLQMYLDLAIPKRDKINCNVYRK